MERARALAKRFHSMPQDAKEACVAGLDELPFGYRDQRKISLDPEGQAQPDTRESFLFSADHPTWYTVDQDMWVGRLPPDFKTSLSEYWAQVQSLSKTVLDLACGALGVEAGHFDMAGHFDQSLSLMSLIRYEETLSRPEEGLLGCGAHCDFGAVTVLQQDPEVSGLQVAVDKHVPRDQMVWKDVPPQRGTFVISCGMALENWSNGQFQANLHRVVSSQGRERVSVPFFLQPNAACTISPLRSCVPAGEAPRYQPVQFGEFIRSRFVATGRTKIGQSDAKAQRDDSVATPSHDLCSRANTHQCLSRSKL